MRRKLRVAVLFGGRSAEHEVSLQSARNVIDAIDPARYEVVAVGIDKQGRWRLGDAARLLLSAGDPRRARLGAAGEEVVVAGGRPGRPLVRLNGEAAPGRIDVVFPVLHGTYGEDGTVQGLLKLADVPFVGPGVLGSAAGMDKDVAKRLLRDAGIPVARFVALDAETRAPARFGDLAAALGVPLFVKPANLGSSVGVSKVHDRRSLRAALDEAFAYDRKVLVEEFVPGREIECAVLGNARPEASVPGEVVPAHDFYSYEAKYLDEKGAALKIPAPLDPATEQRVRELAVRSFRAIGCEGMARVDFFLKPDGALVVNELNTIPGFTRISMYPRLWAASGVAYPELIDRLIALALERHAAESRLRTSFTPAESPRPAGRRQPRRACSRPRARGRG